MKTSLRPPPEVIDAIKERRRAAAPPDLKDAFFILHLWSTGRPEREVAETLSISRTAVQRVVTAFRSVGFDLDRFEQMRPLKRGRRRALDREERSRLRQRSLDPSATTANLAKEFGVSERTVFRVLTEATREGTEVLRSASRVG